MSEPEQSCAVDWPALAVGDRGKAYIQRQESDTCRVMPKADRQICWTEDVIIKNQEQTVDSSLPVLLAQDKNRCPQI